MMKWEVGGVGFEADDAKFYLMPSAFHGSPFLKFFGFNEYVTDVTENEDG